MMASQPGICSERCQRNSTCSPRTAPTAWYASSSQFEPGNTTTPNFIARNLPKKILTHQRDCPERRNSEDGWEPGLSAVRFLWREGFATWALNRLFYGIAMRLRGFRRGGF